MDNFFDSDLDITREDLESLPLEIENIITSMTREMVAIHQRMYERVRWRIANRLRACEWYVAMQDGAPWRVYRGTVSSEEMDRMLNAYYRYTHGTYYDVDDDYDEYDDDWW